jgi:colanic acid biosynthesis glycosyl transferase WcaI
LRILFLSMYFAPDTAANAVIMTELVEELSELGHEITVVSAFPHYGTNKIWDEYKGKLFQSGRYGRARVFRTYLYVPKDKTGFAGRVLNYLSFNLFSTLLGLFSGKYDVIFAPSPPLTIGLSAWLISRLKRVPYVYNVQDIYPDIAVRLGILTNQKAIKAFQLLEKFVYKRAAAISVLSSGFQQNLLRKGVEPGKLAVIPNFVDVDFVRPLPKDNPFSCQQGLHNKFTVMYAGNVGLSQGLETVLEAADQLRDLGNLVFLVVGNGAAKEALERQAGEMGLPNISFLPFQPRECLPEMYASADVSLVIIREGVANESVPSKTYTILASGRPVIAAIDPGSETWNLIEEAGCGICIRPEDPTALAWAVRELYNDAAARARYGENGRCFVVKNYTRQKIAHQYHRLFTGLKSK